MFRQIPWLTWLLTLTVAGVTARLGAALLIGENAALDHAVRSGWSPTGTFLIGGAQLAAAGLLLFPRSAAIGGALLAGVLASTPGAQSLAAEAPANLAGVLTVAAAALSVAFKRVPDLVEAVNAALPTQPTPVAPAGADGPSRNEARQLGQLGGMATSGCGAC